MSQPKVTIIGAGIGGLVLARSLLKRGIRSTIYERDSPSRAKNRYGYGISLRSQAYRLLLPLLGIDEASFRRQVAVDGSIGGEGYLAGNKQPSGKQRHPPDSFRANRRELEQLLRKGLDIEFESFVQLANRAQSVTIGSADGSASGLELHGQPIETDILVGADGPHSRVRALVDPESDFKVLPFAVYRGQRRINGTTFEQSYAQYFDKANSIQNRIGNVLLQVNIDERDENRTSISYTYSRPADRSDPLFMPGRSTSGATEIPPQLFEEIASLHELAPPFSEVFNVDSIRSDRLLNWLMRAILVERSTLEEAARRGIVLMGDSCHHGPILGSLGANLVIEDAIDLAEVIATQHSSGLVDYHRRRYQLWKDYIAEGEDELAAMHGQSKASLVATRL